MERNSWAVAALSALLWICAQATSAQELTPADVSHPLSERRSLGALDHLSSGYSAKPSSDAVAQLDRRLQNGMSNLLVRLAWDTRFALAPPASSTNESLTRTLLANNAREFVDDLLFVEEAPFPGAVDESAFAKDFEAKGPFDAKGRSSRQLDLSRRLLRTPAAT